MAKARRRLTRKEAKEDELAEFLAGAAEFTREHSKVIVGIALVAVVGALVFVVATRERRAAEQEAQTWIWRANLDLKSGSVGSAIQSYDGIMDRYPGTWGYSDANFFLANAQFAVGRYDTALVLFEKYLNLKKRRDQFTVSAKMGVAQCLEEIGRYQDAADSFLKVQREHPGNPLAPDALLGAARCYELAGDAASAERVYNDLLERYPESNQTAFAKMRLLEIQARLENT